MSDPTPDPRAARLEAAWRELEADALASDGPIRDRDVKDAIKRNRARIEEAAALTVEPRGSGVWVKKHRWEDCDAGQDCPQAECNPDADGNCRACGNPFVAPTPPPADESAERHEWEGMASYPECSCGWRGHAGSHDYGVSQHKEHVAAARKEGHRE